mmetsp:Transcript_19776/g.33920  ORF Transcript_19776/g.33920 Transcript_19776/m.33920 type:complete len:98 (-) Transcript_19776:1505-1798(-)
MTMITFRPAQTPFRAWLNPALTSFASASKTYLHMNKKAMVQALPIEIECVFFLTVIVVTTLAVTDRVVAWRKHWQFNKGNVHGGKQAAHHALRVHPY